MTKIGATNLMSVTVTVTDTEAIHWDSRTNKLLYVKDQQVQFLEGTSKETRVRMRPFLTDLVRKARAFYTNA